MYASWQLSSELNSARKREASHTLTKSPHKRRKTKGEIFCCSAQHDIKIYSSRISKKSSHATDFDIERVVDFSGPEGNQNPGQGTIQFQFSGHTQSQDQGQHQGHEQNQQQAASVAVSETLSTVHLYNGPDCYV